MDEIKSEMSSLSQILLTENTVFHIPEFQRDFVWGKDEVSELFNDFMNDTNNFSKDIGDLQGYLLGNVVLIEKSKNQYLVIDGQQRLTTITLLFKVLYDKIDDIISQSSYDNRDKWLKRIGQISNGYHLMDEEDNFKGLKITHDNGLSFGEFYRDLILDKADLEFIPTKVSDKNIKEVYEELNDKISELSDLQTSKFINYIKNKVKLIVTTAPSEGKAFQLFEVLNDRGRSLEPMDLIKNTFLKTLRNSTLNDEDVNNFNKNWNGFLDNLQINNKKKISSSTFMKHFILSVYGVKKKQEELFDYFQIENKLTADEIIDLTKKLKEYSSIYKSIEIDCLNNDFLSDNSDMHIIFKVLGIKQFHPLLMCFYKSSNDIKEQVVDVCANYGATIIFSLTQTNTIEKELISIINNINKKTNFKEKEKVLKNLLMTEINNYSEKMLKTVSEHNFTNSSGKPLKKSYAILEFIELKYNENHLIIHPKNKITLEHILATKTKIDDLKKYEFKDRDEFNRYINRIGNLTLLYSDENASAGINEIKEKKEIYKNSSFIITRTMVKKEETGIKNGVETKKVKKINETQPVYITSDYWTKSKIEERGINLADLVLKIIRH